MLPFVPSTIGFEVGVQRQGMIAGAQGKIGNVGVPFNFEVVERA